ncbi:MAG TPA: uracil-DNA glycosylase [Thermoplasmata archaeon]|nr:uracil-DNA glycosylase [Thermoplasmata archaeon]
MNRSSVRPSTPRSALPSRRPRRASDALRAEWEQLSREIHACRKCPLGAIRTHAVVYRGGLAPRVVFVGEAPGAEEDRLGVPFVGRSGRLLDQGVASLGLAGGEVGVLNVLKCRPPENKFDSRAARTCRPYLDRQLQLLRPEVIVTLGARALAAVEPLAPPVLRAAGRPLRHGHPPRFPLLHPAAALRSRRLRERWDRDFRALGRWLRKRTA